MDSLQSAGVIVNDEGSSIVVAIDPDLYPKDIALRAAYWLTDRWYVSIDHSRDGHLTATIRAKDDRDAVDLTGACGEFCNALVDFAVRARVSEETKDIQEALLKRAFLKLLPKVTN